VGEEAETSEVLLIRRTGTDGDPNLGHLKWRSNRFFSAICFFVPPFPYYLGFNVQDSRPRRIFLNSRGLEPGILKKERLDSRSFS
jgi:hypothetical protein